MTTRRDFLKDMAVLSGATGLSFVFPPAIQKALAINPEPGSTYLDAEHIVLLMQENRSFDHAFGTLRGVRGFNDPRAINLPNQNRVWLQSSKAGETYAPFRLNIKDTKITWMGSLPHGRYSQVGARNEGMHDGWIDAKKADSEYAHMPLTMGYYTRDDIPFYYALADAFTVCDQNFCSALSPTDPNRLYFWSGTVREEQDENVKAHIDNDDIERGVEWDTFPELLERCGVSWKVYQNELSVEGGFSEEQDNWLGNFGDNPLEFFKQYQVRLSDRHTSYLPLKVAALETEIGSLKTKIQALPPADASLNQLESQLEKKQAELTQAKEDQQHWTKDRYEALSAFHQNIHQKAFAANHKDPFQHELTPLVYQDGTTERTINIPKGDVLHRFREDVANNQLPTVSWLVAPEYFSDHPSAPWFGSWYLSEAMDILTKNPEVWKKTIFVLAYDENDGYFDHVPPFVAPDPQNPGSGSVSSGIDAGVEQVRIKEDFPGSIGLGFRVPLVIASPWSRGGWVNSQVFDHTSTLQFLEDFLQKKYGKKVVSPNITEWRRTVCGDLTTVFRPDKGDSGTTLPFVVKEPFIEDVHKAKFKEAPKDYKLLTAEEISLLNRDPYSSPYMPSQERGIRSSCPLPYELHADGRLDGSVFGLELRAGNDVFGSRSLGSPFNVYSNGKTPFRAYAVSAGDALRDSWNLADFEQGVYHLSVYGPNGFFREFKGNEADPRAVISCLYQPASGRSAKLSGNVFLHITNQDLAHPLTVEIRDNAYKTGGLTKVLGVAGSATAHAVIPVDLAKSFGWYDVSVAIKGNNTFLKRYAGHVETGAASFSDPAMGRMI